MRQAGVLDVGCHSALLTVVRRRPGSVLEPVFSRKVRLSLHETLDRKGRLEKAGMKSVERAVAEAVAADPRLRGPEVFAFATSVIRDAPNRDEIIARVARTTGTRLRVLTGEEEARLAYVAARQWAGPTAGQLLVLDIGGGTVEIASGTGDQPRVVKSLPLGARRITRDWLPGGTAPSRRRLAEVLQHLGGSLEAVPGLPQAELGGRVLACSKTFEQLARLAAAQSRTPRARRWLTLSQLRTAVSLLADAAPSHRAKLPGISRHRAEQSLAGALIAQALMEACGAKRVEICPWSTREGLLLEHLGVAPAPVGRPRLVG
ncbi:Ppx/GppA phosphatase family protein [Streptomyces sp. B21-108]|jgi:exopolyphosphatase/guanosine-5'-triphosphate,3'-diphosphate pyrophosphatase|uniref:Ppx/GppA phosphatase family protein n=1 Tax=Streptomyces sp. B21-108 TaxID=3039419 RepID=UPI002FF34002